MLLLCLCEKNFEYNRRTIVKVGNFSIIKLKSLEKVSGLLEVLKHYSFDAFTYFYSAKTR